MKTVNIGLVGVGGVGRIHFHNILKLKNAKLVAVADTSKKSRSFAKTYGVKQVYDDFDKLLRNPIIDCVIISLPNFLHSKCAIMAAEHGKHILVEKPLARNVKEGEEVVSKVQRAGVKAMIGYPLRFSEFATIKREIENGVLGDIVVANATNVSSGPFFARISTSSVPSSVPSWWFKPELVGGGALLDLGSHMIDILLWYFGDKITSVKSVLGYRFNMPYEDHALCFIKFRNGVLATINVGWYSIEAVAKVELFGTVRISARSMKATPEKMPLRILRLLGINSVTQTPAFYNELNYFVRCLLNNGNPSPSLTDGLRDLEIISLAYQNELK